MKVQIKVRKWTFKKKFFLDFPTFTHTQKTKKKNGSWSELPVTAASTDRNYLWNFLKSLKNSNAICKILTGKDEEQKIENFII